MEATSVSASTRHESSTRRYHLRVPAPAPLPLWWWVLLLLAFLLFLFATLVTAGQMQRDVAREAQGQLSAAGVEVLASEADGQRVALTAIGAEDAVARYGWIAESARCDTWAGRLRCPTESRVSVQSPAPMVVEPPAPEQPAEPFASHLRISTTEDVLRLEGQVPSEAVREALVRGAAAQATRVDDQLQVHASSAEQEATPPAQAAGLAALSVLARLIRGEAHWLDGTLSVAGIVDEAEEAAATLAFSDAASQVSTGHLWLQVARDALDCNTTFAELLNDATIHFSTGSAQIPREDDALLAALASLANQCPGALLVEGHTDNVGDAQDNQVLSAARAGAVVSALVALGVDGARLRSEGFGEATPVASNESASGRAQNRRIVVRLRDVVATTP